MKPIALLFAVSMLGAAPVQQAPQRDAPVAIATGAAVIRGVVVGSDAAHRPIRRARVVLSGVPGGRVAVTDDAGAFVFDRLPAGNYTLTSSKPAYLPANLGASMPGRAGTAIVLADKQSADVSMSMTLGGVVTGTIRDGRGRPIAGVDVGLIPLATADSPRMGFSAQPVTTDERGEYRLYGVPPGQYYVAAVMQNFMTSGTSGRRTVEENDAVFAQLQSRIDGALVVGAPAKKVEPLPFATAAASAPTMYPGTPRIDAASLVTVVAGAERVGIDFAVQPVRAASIDGTVQGPVLNLDRVELSLVIDGPQFPQFSSSRPILTQPPDARGRFHYDNLPPAHYTVLARAVTGAGDASVKTQNDGVGFAISGSGGRSGGAGPGPGQEYVYGKTDIDIDGSGVSGMSVNLTPGGTASGKLVIDRALAAAPDDLTQIRISMMSPVLSSVSVSSNTRIGNHFDQIVPGAMKPDGTWEVRGIPPGLFLWQVSLPPAMVKDWWLRSAVLNGRDLLDAAIDVQPGQDLSGIEFTLTDRHNELSGTLTTAEGKAATDYFIIVCPSDPTLWTPRSRRVKSLRPSSNGAFSVKDLPAGEYVIAALTDVAPGEWNDPQWLASVAPSGAKITIVNGEKTVQNLRVGGLY